jgi:MFS family permease
MIKNLIEYFKDKESRTVGLFFSINSIFFGSWITRLPDIQDRIGISEGELGLALLGIPLGSVSAMPFISYFIQKYGAGRVTIFISLIFCIVSTFPVFALSHLGLFIILTMVGIVTGSMDISMNAAAAIVEEQKGRPIMSTCHGLWSLGGMIGAASTSILAGLSISGKVQMPVLAVLLFIVIGLLSKTMLKVRETTTDKARIFVLPRGILIGLALIAFCVMLGESAIMDWSTIYLRKTLNTEVLLAGMGFAGFSLTMALGRFYGDVLITKWGSRKLVLIGLVVAITGVLSALVIQNSIIAILGFTFAGFGFSGLVPAVYISSAKVPGVSAGEGLASVASLGYFGLFVGPPTIGMIAEEYGLNLGLGFIIVLLSIALIITNRIKF